jgi:excisionase family DNA binding protein
VTLTLTEAAERLATSPDNLRGAIKRGTLKATKRGRDWFVDAEEVERYGRENRRRVGSVTP